MMERLKTLLACGGLIALIFLFAAAARNEARIEHIRAEQAR